MAYLLAAILALSSATSASVSDQATPRRALRTFLDATDRGDYRLASKVLDLGRLPEQERVTVGEKLARQLAFIVEAQLWIDWDQIPDEEEGAGDRKPVLVGELSANELKVPLRMVRGTDGSWRIGPSVLAAIPRLYHHYGPAWVGDRLPAIFIETRLFGIQLWQWIGLLVASVLGLAFASGFRAAGKAVTRALKERREHLWNARLANDLGGPVRLLIATCAFALVEQGLGLAADAQVVIRHLMRMSVVVSFSWAAVRGLRIAADLLVARAPQRASDPSAVRARVTQVMMLWRIAAFAIVIMAGSVVLMQFDALRALGTSLLASAGVAGVIAGLAGQRSFASVFAGIQLSLTRPIRVGDIVVIEGESGTIEEITLTYVVVRAWDLRRLIVPIARFLDSSFQNWTRTGASIMGTASVYADYAVPVAELRREVATFVATQPEWDGRVVALTVSNATEHSIQLTAVVSSADSDRNGALRDAVREHLVGVLQRLESGRYLPRTRVESHTAEEHIH